MHIDIDTDIAGANWLNRWLEAMRLRTLEATR
jgi:hypothetical protein